MAAYPSLELDDGAGAVAAARELEDMVLHRFTRRTPAVSTRAELGDRVLTSVLLAPETIGLSITRIVRCHRDSGRRHFGAEDGVGDGSGAGHWRRDRHGADVDEGRNRGRGETNDYEKKGERIPHG